MVGVSGLVSGLDTEGIIRDVMAAARRPVRAMEVTRGGFEAKQAAFRELNTLLADLETALEAADTPVEFSNFSAGSSQEAALGVSVSGASSPGSYDITVNAVASNSIEMSAGAASQTATIADGTFDVTIAGTTTSVTVDAASGTNTLATLAQEINDTVVGANAYVLDTGAAAGATRYRLVVSASDPGTANAATTSFTQTGSGTGVTMSAAQAATDAELVFGGTTITSSTNTVEGVIPGVSLQLNAPTSGAARVTVVPDMNATADLIDDVVEAYNDVVDFFNEEAGGTGEDAGPLVGDSTVRTIERRLANVLSSGFGVGAITGLDAVGLSTDGNTGTLEFSRSDFTAAMTTNAADVMATLSGTTGLFATLGSTVEAVTDPTTGLIEPRIDGLDDSIENITESIERQELRLEAEEARMRNQFTALEMIMGEYEATESFLTQQFELNNNND